MATNNSTISQMDENEKIQIVIRQTNYSEEEVREKLKEYSNDYIRIIKDYIGAPEKTPKAKTSVSINQEIYKQIRYRLDSSMRDYQQRVDDGKVKKIV